MQCGRSSWAYSEIRNIDSGGYLLTAYQFTLGCEPAELTGHGGAEAPEPFSEFIVPVGKWSDGTAVPTNQRGGIARFRYLLSKLLPELVFSGLHNFQRREE